MATYHAQIGFPFDSAFPRDVVTINPHYNGDNAQGLADALKQNLIAAANVPANMPFTIKVYDAKAPKPSYPLATASQGTGFTVTTSPRELALCLSYYATWNRPSYRGRMYIPHFFLGGALGLRPTQTQMLNALAWRGILGSGLPAQTVWSLYSRKTGLTSGVSHAWVDDEWDIVRSRGLRGTTRETAPVP
jgi:hypothetical protein